MLLESKSYGWKIKTSDWKVSLLASRMSHVTGK